MIDRYQFLFPVSFDFRLSLPNSRVLTNFLRALLVLEIERLISFSICLNKEQRPYRLAWKLSKILSNNKYKLATIREAAPSSITRCFTPPFPFAPMTSVNSNEKKSNARRLITPNIAPA